MTSRIVENFEKNLAALEDKGRFRSLSLPDGIDLTSNDYLGMAADRALRELAQFFFARGGDVGAAGSRLLRGHTYAHAHLEAYLNDHFACGGALFSSSGFQMNFAVLTTLPQKGDLILYDSLIHASMRDGITACRARAFKFKHNDLEALETLLIRHRSSVKGVWIAVESVYSMDGDTAPLADLYHLAEKYDAMLLVDEAHGTGVCGDQGKGLSWDLVQQHGYDRLITLHTCGKAIGVAGGFICASEVIISYMINAARPFIYSTAPMPVQAYLVEQSLRMIAGALGDSRRQALNALSARAHAAFGGAGTHIVPLIIGEDAQAVAAADAMKGVGYDIRAIRPPTVPTGTARLRLSLSTLVSQETLDDFIKKYQKMSKI